MFEIKQFKQLKGKYNNNKLFNGRIHTNKTHQQLPLLTDRRRRHTVVGALNARDFS